LEDSEILCRTAALVAAATLFERLPGSVVLEAGAREGGFFLRCIPSYTPPPEIARLIEEGMRQIIKEKRPFRAVEMTAFSAQEMFRKIGHEEEEAALDEVPPSALVSVAQIGDFYKLAEGPFSPLSSLSAFQILSFVPLPEGAFELEGCVAVSREELKIRLQRKREYKTRNHYAVGLQKGFWEGRGESFLWLEPGLQYRSKLLETLKKFLCQDAFQVASSSREAIDGYGWRKKGSLWSLSEVQAPPDLEGGKGALFWRRTYVEEKNLPSVLTSCLQSIHQTLIILGFRSSFCLGKQRGGKGKMAIESMVKEVAVPWNCSFTEDPFHGWKGEDGLGCFRYAIEWELEPQSQGIVLEVRLEVEKILALLLEQTSGANWTNGNKA
jgi:hypothetical protein